MFTTLDELYSFLEGFTNFQKPNTPALRRARMGRMESLLAVMGNPHLGLPIIHIAGSKGKGSTAALIAGGLSRFGARCGLYLSPHISDYRERISLNGQFFPDQLYLEEGAHLANAISELPEYLFGGDMHPTTFELLTCLAFLIFKRAECDWVALETGIGGRLDATNVVEPKASVITKIELEHGDILGMSLEEIAFEKGGIIKKGTPIFSAPQKPEVLTVLKRISAKRKAPFYYLPDLITIKRYSHTLESATVLLSLKENSSLSRAGTSQEEEVNLELAMLGEVQAENAALSLLLFRTLKEIPTPPAPQWESLFSTTRLPGRFEYFPLNPPIFIDGAHTEDSVREVCRNIRETARDGVVIFGAVSGKRIEAMAKLIISSFSTIIVSRPGTFKTSDPDGVFHMIKDLSEGNTIFLEPEPKAALKKARFLSLSKSQEAESIEEPLPILVIGSFYLAGEIRSLLIGKNPQENES